MGRGRPAGLIAALVLASCGSGPGDEGNAAVASASHGPACPISAESRRLLAAFSSATETEIEVATLGCSASEVAFASALVASDALPEAFVHLAVTCSGPRVDAGVTCTSDLGGPAPVSGVDTCFAIGCEDANLLLVDVYATTPDHRAPDDRVPLSYASTSPYPSASVTYTPNPLIRWRCDARSEPAVSATLSESPVVSFVTGETVDFTFAGEVTGVRSGDSASLDISVSFPRLASHGAVELTIRREAGRPLSGTVVLGDETLATMTEGGITWQGACAD